MFDLSLDHFGDQEIVSMCFKIYGSDCTSLVFGMEPMRISVVHILYPCPDLLANFSEKKTPVCRVNFISLMLCLRFNNNVFCKNCLVNFKGRL